MTMMSRFETAAVQGPRGMARTISPQRPLRAGRRRLRHSDLENSAGAGFQRELTFARDLFALGGLFGTLYGWTWFAAALGVS